MFEKIKEKEMEMFDIRLLLFIILSVNCETPNFK